MIIMVLYIQADCFKESLYYTEIQSSITGVFKSKSSRGAEILGGPLGSTLVLSVCIIKIMQCIVVKMDKDVLGDFDKPKYHKYLTHTCKVNQCWMIWTDTSSFKIQLNGLEMVLRQ